jgi:hypothetical protein
MFLLTLASAAVVAAVGVVAMSKKPGTVYPFAPVKPTAADTITSVAADTVFADEGWSVATLTRLSEVEDLLDSLEAHGIREREVRVMGNSSFRVRWK